MVEIEIIRTETIKPSSPTPDGLKRFNLSVFDQFMPDVNLPIVFFYPAGGESSFSDRIKRLKLSLSETLVRFYPLAGRLVKDERYVDCDDGGVDFVEARVKGCRLSDILGRPDDNVIRKMVPAESDAQPIARVQANMLTCGGMAIGMHFRHLVMDACAMGAFLKGWAAVARGDSEAPAPHLDAIASRFPAIPLALPPILSPEWLGCSTRRFVFQAAGIAALRDKSAGPDEERPTRLAAVSALIWKCMVNTLTKKTLHESTRPLIVSQAVNLRRRFEPPLSENSLGNMIGLTLVESGGRNDVQRLASQLRQGVRDLTQSYVPVFQDSEVAITTICDIVKRHASVSSNTEDKDFYVFTSWCRFGWYEVDFGWGRPTWMSTVNPNMKNVVVMMDTRDGDGIEVLAILPEEDMTFFETDPELLEFASLNPSVP